MTTPLVTALIDTCNYGRYVEDAINSAREQGFPAADLEILVVDDGSTDDTPERVRKFGSRVRYLAKSRGGQASALNVGIREARGSIVAFLDADDVWLPGKVGKVTAALEREPSAGLLYHSVIVWDTEEGREFELPFRGVSGSPLDNLRVATSYAPQAASGLVMRRQTALQVGPIPQGLTIMADGFLGSAGAFVAPVLSLNEALTKYRVHGSNLFAFKGSDPSRMRLKLQSQRLLLSELRNWFAARYDVNHPCVAAHLKMHELFERRLSFSTGDVSRWQFFSHIRDSNRLYRPVWSRAYSAFKAACAPLALLLGYRAYGTVSRLYARSPLRKLRERVINQWLKEP